ncbi:RNA 2',3'-cyclic phosphodiesterase [Pseudonocardia sp. RS010]|uniref:RNA 2',3'-cyclic phosphodiesterase n=1 Tax=Pseudonocardia sp. RS010 TaxID=3385979 RepID=UPI00399F83FF
MRTYHRTNGTFVRLYRTNGTFVRLYRTNGTFVRTYRTNGTFVRIPAPDRAGPGRIGRVRAFVALVPPAEAIEELAAAVAPVRRDHRGTRWTRPEQWHLTLAFLGEIDEPTLEAVQVGLSAVAARTAPVELALAGAGRFGERVLWVGLEGDRDGLAALAAGVAASARTAGVPLEDRAFRAHLTLARGRGGVRGLAPAVRSLAGFTGRTWRAGTLHLVRSRPGPVYEDLATWPLAGATGRPADLTGR